MTTPPPPSAKVLCCPFCGEMPTKTDDGPRHIVHQSANGCPARGVHYEASWNRRSQPQPEAQAVPCRHADMVFSDAFNEQICYHCGIRESHIAAASAGAVAWIWFNNDVANGRRDNVGIYDHDLPPAKRELGWTSIPLYAQPSADLVGVLAESLFEHIKHGDLQHQAWLRKESLVWCQKNLASLPTRAPEDKA